MSNGYLRITLRRSPIGYEKSQRKTVVALGLGKLNSTVVQPDNPAIRGMIHKITHLLEVVPAEAPAKAEAAPAVVEEPKKRTTRKKAEEEAPAAETPAEAASAKKPARRRPAKKTEEPSVAEEQEETK